MSNKIVIILSSFKSGGAEKMMIHLANGFASNGYSLALFVIRPVGPLKSLVNRNINVVEAPNLKSIYFYIPWLAYQLIKINPTRIISSQRHINIITMISALSTFNARKVVLREANPPTVSIKRGNSKSSFNTFLAKCIYPLAWKYVAISEHVKFDMAKHYNLDYERIKVIYSPIITESFSDLCKEDLNDDWVKSDNKLILSVGRISPVKDYLTLIKAFNKIGSQEKFQLLILGNHADMEYFHLLKREIENYKLNDFVKFTGFVENPYAYMSKADLFVLSSKWEGFGNVLVEALACGCPVVSTDCPGGPREILDNGKYGKLVPVGDADEMAKAILSSLESPTNKKTLINRGYEFTQEKSVNEYLNYIFATD